MNVLNYSNREKFLENICPNGYKGNPQGDKS